MELITHYSKSLRRAYERSISEQNYENHHRFTENIFLKGQNQNFLKERSYHEEVTTSNDLIAKDLTVSKTIHNNELLHERQQVRLNGICSSNKIKQEEEIIEEPMTSASIRRYFCIFCKMDFSNADIFLDHLELHTNGSFVLVKRDFISIPQQQLSPNNTKKNNINNNNDNVSNPQNSHSSDRTTGVVENNNNIIINNNNNNNNNHHPMISDRLEESVAEEEISNLPIVPEVLKNQIKIEPISEDEEDDVSIHINDNRISESNSQHFNDSNETTRNIHSSSPPPIIQHENNSTETGDPNQQLMVLSNPRIGDGPGEYLCNVCHAKFVYKNNLKSHLKRHLGIYPYVCFCGKRYQFKCKLNKHIEQAHAKIKNFKCPVPTCPKKYFTRNDLAFHISVTHQERQEIPCNICQKVFNSQKSLQIHCRKYHRNQEA